MSFAAIRNTASSALTTTQVRLSIAAANIANADTAGYTQKTGVQTMTSMGGLGAGVTVSAITSAVDKYLLKDMATALTALGAATVNDTFADRLQALFGAVDGDDSSTTLANSVTALETALAQLAGTPESTTLRALVVDALDSLASDLRSASSGIQELRANADSGIEDSVNLVNQQLETIDALNMLIGMAQARGESTVDLEDQRNTALQAIASEMNVSSYVTSDSQMKIYTGSGVALLDSAVHKLSYEASSFVTTGTVFSPITVEGQDITGTVTSGTMGALIDQRDEILPLAQDELDELATALMGRLNAIYNQGTMLPAPGTLTSTTTVAATDTFAGTGTLRIATVDDQGALVSYGDFDLSTFATVSDFVAAINATGSMSAGIDAGGKLTIASTSGDGIALADIDSSVSGQGVSDYFGFNDLMTGTSALNIAVRSDIKAKSDTLSMAVLSTDDSPTIGAKAVSVSSAIASNLQSAMLGETTFSAAGTLSAKATSFVDYAGLIASGAALRADSAATTLTSKQNTYDTLASAFASQTGVNVDEETALVTELTQQYSTAAQLLQALNDMFDALLSAVK
ncbi:MAG: flagellar hook-associated protein FlgK [Devosia sp.]|uniref:flagellar hook-associated protein FlgK n=1 Tax=Devosia sp. TaxID=1871048 RepID=UPI003390FD9D